MSGYDDEHVSPLLQLRRSSSPTGSMGVGLYSTLWVPYTLRIFDGGLARALRQRAPLAQRLPTLAKAVAWLSLAWGPDATAWEACLESCKGLFERMAAR